MIVLVAAAKTAATVGLVCLTVVALCLAFVALCIAVGLNVFKADFKCRDDNLDGRKVEFKSGKNILKGWFWNESGKNGIVVISHGMGVDVKYYLPEINAFAADGFKVFSYQYTGYGESKGSFSGFEQAVLDLKNAIDFVYDQSLPLILWGHSMGAYASAAVGQLTDKKVAAIIAYAPFSSPKAAVKKLTSANKFSGRAIAVATTISSALIFGKNSNLSAANGLKRLGAPTLVLQGKNDEEVPAKGCSLYALRKELPSFVTCVLVSNEGSDGHMTVVRKKGETTVNRLTFDRAREFLQNLDL